MLRFKQFKWFKGSRGSSHGSWFGTLGKHQVEKLKMTPAMIGGFGVRSALRVSAWLSGWSRHDPDRPHFHLGPIGVEPAAQGRASAIK